MKITFKLYATLQHLLPADAVDNAVEVEVDEQVSLFDVIDRFRVPRESAHLVLINGVYFGDDERSQAGLISDGDVIAIWPPVAGG
jgi:molybdopterin converting factor small subunit